MKGTGALFGIVNNTTNRSYYFKIETNQFVSGAFDKTGTTTSYTGHWHEFKQTYAAGTNSLLNSWYHVAFSVSNAVSTCYINGVALPTTADMTAPNGTTSFTCCGVAIHGTRDYGGTSVSILTGRMDEVILESRAWSAAEVAKYYENSKGQFYGQVAF